MSNEQASPMTVRELGTQEKRLAQILLRYLKEVKEPIETSDFLERIVAEEDS